ILRQSAKSAGKSMALQEATHLFGKPSPDPLSRSDFLDTRFPQPIDRPKLSQQQIFAAFTHPGAIIENTFVDSFLEQKLVIRVREPMRFVPDSLKQVERAGTSWQVQRHRPTRPINFLVLLGQTDDRQIMQTQSLQFATGRRKLPFAAIYDYQIRQTHVGAVSSEFDVGSWASRVCHAIALRRRVRRFLF